MSTQLYTLPPARSRGHHKQTVESVRCNVLRTFVVDSESVITDALTNRSGDPFFEDDFVLFEESASKETPQTGTGRLWVRNDTPTKLIFTNDSGVDLELTPALGDMLTIGNDADDIALVNVGQLNFNSSIVIGNVASPATSSSNESIAIGSGASVSASHCSLIGSGSSCSNAYGVVIGPDNTLESVSPNADTPGGVVIGNNIDSYGAAICIGKNIVNSCTNQDTNATIIIGQDVAFAGSTGGAIAVGSNVTPAANSIVIGCTATATGGDNHVVLGFAAQSYGPGNVCIGKASKAIGSANGYKVAAGYNSYASAPYDIAIGYAASTYSSVAHTGSAVAIGAYASASDKHAISIGFGASTTPPTNSQYSISIGYYSYANFNYSVALGSNVNCRVTDEFANRQTRTIYGTVTTVDNTPTTIITFPTLSSDVLHIDVNVTAIRGDGLVTYYAVLRDYHVRNKAGTLTISPTVGTTTQETNDGSTGYQTVIQVASSNIEIDVTGKIDESVTWRAIMRVYGAPLS